MKSVKLAGAMGLALLLAACGSKGDQAGASASEGGDQMAGSAAPADAGSDGAMAMADSSASGQAPVAFAQCKACHSTEEAKTLIGPSLKGIYNTKAAAVAGFEFSPAMKASGLTWDDATLDAFLENPQAKVPGTKMTFFGLKDAAQRKQVIDYLKTL